VKALTSAALGLASLLCAHAQTLSLVHLASPGNAVSADIFIDAQRGLSYTTYWKGKLLAASAHMGLRLEIAGQKHELGSHPVFDKMERGAIDEQYPFLGAKSHAINHANTVTIGARETDGTRYFIEARAYDDGFAWRLMTDARGSSRTQIVSETSTFTMPAGEVWFGERNNAWKLKSYAGEFHHVAVDGLPAVSSQGPVQTAPLVIEMAQDAGYALFTEAALANYSGMRLRAEAARTLHVDFTEGPAGFVVDGAVITPWRVIMLCADLNCLVNSTLTENLNPAPDPALFRDTSYIRAGRSVWRFMSRQTGTPEQEKEFVDYAVALGYEYSLVDDGWKRWATPWASLKEVADYATKRGVGLFAWKDAGEMMEPAGDYAALRDFLDRARNAGLVGVKIDFINGESKAKVDFERRALRLAAERRLMLDFHGIQKPTGEERSFPNGLSREGVRGIELNRMAEGPIPASHNAALPFTRMAIGPADYTPLNLNWPGETTWTHQLATAILLSAPILCIAEDPEFLLKNPDAVSVLPIVQTLPAVWDETIVLQGSRIGGVAGMARRSGSRWYVATINGGANVAPIPALPDALKDGSFHITIVTSPAKRTFLSEIGTDAARWQGVQKIEPGDGVVAVFYPISKTDK
jgi:alpha-glucosidase